MRTHLHRYEQWVKMSEKALRKWEDTIMDCRLKFGLTQEQTAHGLGISRERVRQFEARARLRSLGNQVDAD
jgi:DNA-directed RNA polymerase specialized sigma subunit